MRCPRCGYDPKNQRTLQQNRYYWGVIIKILSDEWALFPYEVHEMIKRKFLTEHHLIRGRHRQVIELEGEKSTTDLSTIEWEELMSNIRIWSSAELGIWIPEPNEVINENRA